MIRTLAFDCFKSLESQELGLGALTILIGSNASGKSNVIDGFRLLSEAVRSDMETAVTRCGGVASVVFQGSEHKSFSLGLVYSVPDPGAPQSHTDMEYCLVVGSH